MSLGFEFVGCGVEHFCECTAITAIVAATSNDELIDMDGVQRGVSMSI
jgi:hypothetical protein